MVICHSIARSIYGTVREHNQCAVYELQQFRLRQHDESVCSSCSVGARIIMAEWRGLSIFHVKREATKAGELGAKNEERIGGRTGEESTRQGNF